MELAVLLELNIYKAHTQKEERYTYNVVNIRHHSHRTHMSVNMPRSWQ